MAATAPVVATSSWQQLRFSASPPSRKPTNLRTRFSLVGPCRCSDRRILSNTPFRSLVLGAPLKSSAVRKSPPLSGRGAKIAAALGDLLSPTSAAMETVFYPVGSQYIWNLALPALSVLGSFGAFKNESSGQNMAYSKFAKDSKNQQIPSKLGMFILYFPAAALSLYWFLTLGDGEGLERVRLIAALLAVHFGKRVLEVLFLHKFSGKQDVAFTLSISGAYAFNTFAMLWVQNYVCTHSPPPSLDLSSVGVAVFTVGVLGNLYHHWILAGLRKDKDGGYQVPQGGLFGLVTCPHYFFEIIDFLGMALASQTFYGLGWFCFTAGYLSGRSVSTKNFYLKKVDGYPKERKNIVPFLF